MARQLVTHIWCDVCLHEGEAQVEAEETPPVTIGTLKPRVLALCEVHRKEFDAFKDLVAGLGQIADSAVAQSGQKEGPNTGDFVCPDPECGKGYRYRSSLDSHVERRHGMTLAQLRARLAGDGPEPMLELPEDAPQGEKPPKVTRTECEHCEPGETVYEWPANKRPTQALGVHLARAHGIKSTRKGQGRK